MKNVSGRIYKKFEMLVVVVGSLMVSAMLLVACGQLPEIALDIDEPAFRGETRVAEMTATPESGEFIDLDTRIREFLNSEGAYTDEVLATTPHKGFDDNKVLMKGNYFGIMESATLSSSMNSMINTNDWENSDITLVYFQGIYLGEITQDSRIIMFMGMVNKEGQRVVVPIGKNVFTDENDDIYILGIDTYQSGFYNMNSHGTTNDGVSVNDIDRLEDMVGNAAVFSCSPVPLQGFALDSLNQAYGAHAEVKNSEIIESITRCRELYNSVPDVRGKGTQVENADGGLHIYNIGNYPGISEIIADDNSDLYFFTLVFVRR